MKFAHNLYLGDTGGRRRVGNSKIVSNTWKISSYFKFGISGIFAFRGRLRTLANLANERSSVNCTKWRNDREAPPRKSIGNLVTMPIAQNLVTANNLTFLLGSLKTQVLLERKLYSYFCSFGAKTVFQISLLLHVFIKCINIGRFLSNST